MLLQQEVQSLLQKLAIEGTVKVSIGGSNIDVRVFKDASKLSLSTPVYFGGNYIPKSVRGCITEKVPFDTFAFETFLTVDEEKFTIALNHLGEVGSLSEQNFIPLLEGFCGLAEEWRFYLDDHDKKDLIYVSTR